MKTFRHEYSGYFNCESACLVHIEDSDPNNVLICFEDLGIGTSVTNMSEELATEIIKLMNLDHNKCSFFEYYGKDGNKFDTITYTWKDNVASGPKWKPGTGKAFWLT